MRDPVPVRDRTRILVSEQGNQVKFLDMFCSRSRGESCGDVQFNSCDCGVYPFSAKAGHCGRNGLAGKAADMRRRALGPSGHISQKTY